MINTIKMPTPAFNNNFKDIKKSDLSHIKNIRHFFKNPFFLENILILFKNLYSHKI
jgi:hypothetical protein